MSTCGVGDKECAICGLGECCLTTMYEDNFELATKEQIVSRIDNNEYPFYKQLMIDTLKNVFDYIYEENQSKFKKGDIVKIKTDYFVVVSVNNKDNVFFAATPDAFICVENSQTYTYGQVNSGWEEINDKVIKVGHISFD